MNTDKPTTTASASQNCAHQYRETETGPIGATCVKCGDFARLKRTIPAEKPTDEAHAIAYNVDRGDGSKLAALIDERDRLQAQAAQLAEACMLACQFLSSAVVDWKTQQAIADKLREALTAYEAAR